MVNVLHGFGYMNYFFIYAISLKLFEFKMNCNKNSAVQRIIETNIVCCCQQNRVDYFVITVFMFTYQIVNNQHCNYVENINSTTATQL